MDKDLERVMSVFVDVGAKMIDEWMFSIEDGTDKMFLTIYPKLISMYDGLEIWIACSTYVYADNGDVEKQARKKATAIKQILQNIKYAPFKDEDAFMLNFSKNKDINGDIELVFYLNPDRPEGFWENHSI